MGALATISRIPAVLDDAERQQRMVNLCDLCRFPVVASYYVNISALVPARLVIRNNRDQVCGLGVYANR
jgi:hypothetical protein